MHPIAAMVGLSLAMAAVPAYAINLTQRDTVGLAEQAGFDACVDWVTKPRSWYKHPDDFPKNVGFEGILHPQATLPPGLLPAELTGKQAKIWRIEVGPNSGVFVVGSYGQPLCNVVGGGTEDYQPGAIALVNDDSFLKNWNRVDANERDEVVFESWRNREIPELSVAISHAAKPGARTDRVQFLATIKLELKDQ